jgi:hypothetical protein
LKWVEATVDEALAGAAGMLIVHLPGGVRLEVADAAQVMLAAQLLRAFGVSFQNSVWERTPEGNSVSQAGCLRAAHGSHPRIPHRRETECRPKAHSQTEFGNEIGLSSMSRFAQYKPATFPAAAGIRW